MFGEQAAQQRAEHAGRAEYRTEQALVLSAFARGDDVADDRHGQHDEAAAAQALQCAEADELRHVLGDAAQRGADEEDDDRGLEQLLAAVLVTELAPQGVAAVEASRYAVTTHDRWFRPPSSLAMVGSAVETIVWSRAASSMPRRSAPMATMTVCRFCPSPGAGLTASVLIP